LVVNPSLNRLVSRRWLRFVAARMAKLVAADEIRKRANESLLDCKDINRVNRRTARQFYEDLGCNAIAVNQQRTDQTRGGAGPFDYTTVELENWAAALPARAEPDELCVFVKQINDPRVARTHPCEVLGDDDGRRMEFVHTDAVQRTRLQRR
jgi:hypothetical protein